jgi:hypothetical protein
VKAYKLENLTGGGWVGVAAAAVIVLALLVWQLLARPIQRRVDGYQAQIDEKDRTLVYNYGMSKFIKVMAKEYGDAVARVSVVTSEAEAISQMKGSIDELARRCGVRVTVMEHNAPVVSEAYSTYVVNIGRFESDMKQLQAFLQAVWQAPGLLRVDRIVLGAGSTPDMVKGSIALSKIMVAAPSAP